MEKKFIKTIGSAIIVASFMFLAFGSGNDDKKSEVKCDNSNEGYKSGYEAGRHSLWDTPEAFKRKCNNGYGMIGKVPPCWDEGFIDGYNNKNGTP